VEEGVERLEALYSIQIKRRPLARQTLRSLLEKVAQLAARLKRVEHYLILGRAESLLEIENQIRANSLQAGSVGGLHAPDLTSASSDAEKVEQVIVSFLRPLNESLDIVEASLLGMDQRSQTGLELEARLEPRPQLEYSGSHRAGSSAKTAINATLARVVGLVHAFRVLQQALILRESTTRRRLRDAPELVRELRTLDELRANGFLNEDEHVARRLQVLDRVREVHEELEVAELARSITQERLARASELREREHERDRADPLQISISQHSLDRAALLASPSLALGPASSTSSAALAPSASEETRLGKILLAQFARNSGSRTYMERQHQKEHDRLVDPDLARRVAGYMEAELRASRSSAAPAASPALAPSASSQTGVVAQASTQLRGTESGAVPQLEKRVLGAPPSTGAPGESLSSRLTREAEFEKRAAAQGEEVEDAEELDPEKAAEKKRREEQAAIIADAKACLAAGKPLSPRAYKALMIERYEQQQRENEEIRKRLQEKREKERAERIARGLPPEPDQPETFMTVTPAQPRPVPAPEATAKKEAADEEEDKKKKKSGGCCTIS
jgi:hypothetical protein